MAIYWAVAKEVVFHPKPLNNSPRMSSNPQNQVLNGPAEEADKAAVRERDEKLVSAAQSGDLDAFNELVTHYRGKVYAMIVNMIRNEAESWDLAQDVFLKAWKALPRFEARSTFYTWLYRITHNVTYDWMRKKKVQGDAEFDDATAVDAEPGTVTLPKQIAPADANLDRGEVGDRITKAIETLSEDHRAVILLKDVDGLRYHEIAEVIGTSIGTVMSRLFYARKKLQAQLKDLRP